MLMLLLLLGPTSRSLPFILGTGIGCGAGKSGCVSGDPPYAFWMRCRFFSRSLALTLPGERGWRRGRAGVASAGESESSITIGSSLFELGAVETSSTGLSDKEEERERTLSVPGRSGTLKIARIPPAPHRCCQRSPGVSPLVASIEAHRLT